MDKLTSTEIIKFLVAITLMLGLGRAFGELFRKIKQAAVVGEIIAGIILGPTILGLISPELHAWIFPQTGSVALALDALVSLSIIFMLLVVGFEVDLSVVLQQGKAALVTGSLGMIIPFGFGAAAAYFGPGLFGVQESDSFIFPFFIGTALAISALPIIARTLMDLNLFKTKLGMMIMAAAMFNDFVGWIVFSIFLGLAGGESHGYSVEVTIGLTLLFTFLMLIVGRKLIHQSLPFIISKFSWPGGILSYVMVIALISAAITENLGVHSIFGAFIAGVAIGDSTHLSERTKEIVNQFITNIFAPLFFVSIGLKVNFISAFDPVIVIVVVVVGFLGKVIGCGLGAYSSGFNKNESLSVGFAMNARGVLEIVLGLVALNAGIINDEIFVAIIILVLLSSVLSGPLLSIFQRGSKTYTLLDLIDSRSFIFSENESKESIIRKMAELLAKRNKLDTDKIYESVLEREKIIPTAIGNSVAIPHARMDVSRPYAAISIVKDSVPYESPDGEPVKILIMLITPRKENELQLQLLSEIGKKFRTKDKSFEYLELSSAEEILSAFKKDSE